MQNLISGIRMVSDSLAQNYNLDLRIFFVIYLLSFIPFYLGYFLLLYGSTRNLEWNDIFKLRLKNNLQWNKQTEIGLYVHLFGRVMPYVYIIIWGRNLSVYVYILIVVAILGAIFLFLKKILFVKNDNGNGLVRIVRKDFVDDSSESENLWNIYNETFKRVNILSPCKQSFDHKDFMEVLKENTVRKYIIYGNDSNLIGLGLITDNLKNTPWISKDYFAHNFPQEYSQGVIFYFMGLAIHENARGNKYSLTLMEHIFDDLPHHSVMGFDHSKNINPILHHFTRVIRQSKWIKRDHIDRQHYHLVRRK